MDLSLIASHIVLGLLFKTLSELTACWCFSLLQKIEHLKETTCVSQNLAHFPSWLLERSDHLRVAKLLCLLFSEHGRVHQALHCTAADRKGNLIIHFIPTLLCHDSVIMILMVIQSLWGGFPAVGVGWCCGCSSALVSSHVLYPAKSTWSMICFMQLTCKSDVSQEWSHRTTPAHSEKNGLLRRDERTAAC